MTTAQMDATDDAAAAARIEAAAKLPLDVAPAPDVPERAKRVRNRSTGNPPGRPRKDGAPAGSEPAPRGRPPVAKKREEQYTRSLAKVGALLYMVNAADGTVFLEGVPKVAAALANVAGQNPRIAKVLDAGASAGVWLELAGAVGMIGVGIGINHGKLPPMLGLLLAGDLDVIRSSMTPPAADAGTDVPRGTSNDAATPLPDAFTVPADAA